jgi:putative hemolysin
LKGFYLIYDGEAISTGYRSRVEGFFSGRGFGIIAKFVSEKSVMDLAIHRISRDDLPRITRDFLNVERVFRTKNPRLARFIPKFVFTLLSRIIHQDEMNRFIWENKDEWGLDYAAAILRDFRITTRVINPPALDPSRKYLIASNHPLGGMDGIALIHESGKLKREVLFPVNDLLMNLPNLYELFIPVNKHGSNADNIRIFNETFQSDYMILYFPAGLVSRKQSGQVRDLEWKKTFLTKAKSSGRDIIPVYIDGRNTDFFYNLANLRKSLGIRTNIEMLFLVDQMYRFRGKEIPITYGKPIPVETFDKRKTDAEWAALLRQHVYKLKDNPNEEFTFVQ